MCVFSSTVTYLQGVRLAGGGLAVGKDGGVHALEAGADEPAHGLCVCSNVMCLNMCVCVCVCVGHVRPF